MQQNPMNALKKLIRFEWFHKRTYVRQKLHFEDNTFKNTHSSDSPAEIRAVKK